MKRWMGMLLACLLLAACGAHQAPVTGKEGEGAALTAVTWHGDTAGVEEWYRFEADGSYLHMACRDGQSPIWVEGSWARDGAEIALTQTAQYTYIAIGRGAEGEGACPVRIEFPQNGSFAYFETRYRLELAGEQGDMWLGREGQAFRPGPDQAQQAAQFRGERDGYRGEAPFREFLTELPWHGDYVLGGYGADRYLFRQDGVFVFAESAASNHLRRKFSTGWWWFDEDGPLCLSATHEINLVGGETREGGIHTQWACRDRSLRRQSQRGGPAHEDWAVGQRLGAAIARRLSQRKEKSMNCR